VRVAIVRLWTKRDEKEKKCSHFHEKATRSMPLSSGLSAERSIALSHFLLNDDSSGLVLPEAIRRDKRASAYDRKLEARAIGSATGLHVQQAGNGEAREATFHKVATRHCTRHSRSLFSNETLPLNSAAIEAPTLHSPACATSNVHLRDSAPMLTQPLGQRNRGHRCGGFLVARRRRKTTSFCNKKVELKKL